MKMSLSIILSRQEKSLRHSGTAAVKLLHSNFVAMCLYVSCNYNYLFFLLILIQVILFAGDDRKENDKMSFLLIMVDTHCTEIFYLRLFLLRQLVRL